MSLSAARSAMLRKAAFTLIELLIVIAIIGILAGLLMPALARAKTNAYAIQCVNNKRQLQIAWLLYPVDNADRLVPHGLNVPFPPQPELGLWWAQGFMTYDGANSENTNVLLLLDPKYAKLGPYTKSAAIYKCPVDKSMVKVSRTQSLPRVRSISMNAAAGGLAKCGLVPDPIKYGAQKLSDITAPDNFFVFIDEHPDSLDFVTFTAENRKFLQGLIDLPTEFGSCPSALHNSSCPLSFADGHVEIHKWLDPRTRPPVTYSQPTVLDYGNSGTSDNPDVRWLKAHAKFDSN